MSKPLYTFLVAAGSLFVLPPTALALEPRDDLFIHVLNLAGHSLEVCNFKLTFCKEIKSGDAFDDAQATGGRSAEYFEVWITHGVVKVCGKVVPLKGMVGPATEKKGGWGKVTYNLVISEEGYIRECGVPR